MLTPQNTRKEARRGMLNSTVCSAADCGFQVSELRPHVFRACCRRHPIPSLNRDQLPSHHLATELKQWLALTWLGVLWHSLLSLAMQLAYQCPSRSQVPVPIQSPSVAWQKKQFLPSAYPLALPLVMKNWHR